MLLSSPLFTVCAALALPLIAVHADSPVILKLTGDPGPYDVGRWKKDWSGCEWEDGIKEGHASLVRHDDTNWLRITYATGQIGPEKCGVGWRWPIGTHESAELRYTVRFSRDFDWVKGGKLPGLCGGPDNVSGGRPATGTNGFSARLMWRKDGRGEAYMYHKIPEDRLRRQLLLPRRLPLPHGQARACPSRRDDEHPRQARWQRECVDCHR